MPALWAGPGWAASLGSKASSPQAHKPINTVLGQGLPASFGVSAGVGGHRLRAPSPAGPLMLVEDNCCLGWIVT